MKIEKKCQKTLHKRKKLIKIKATKIKIMLLIGKYKINKNKIKLKSDLHGQIILKQKKIANDNS